MFDIERLLDNVAPSRKEVEISYPFNTIGSVIEEACLDGAMDIVNSVLEKVEL
jgi:hypothetical protein